MRKQLTAAAMAVGLGLSAACNAEQVHLPEPPTCVGTTIPAPEDFDARPRVFDPNAAVPPLDPDLAAQIGAAFVRVVVNHRSMPGTLYGNRSTVLTPASSLEGANVDNTMVTSTNGKQTVRPQSVCWLTLDTRNRVIAHQPTSVNETLGPHPTTPYFDIGAITTAAAVNTSKPILLGSGGTGIRGTVVYDINESGQRIPALVLNSGAILAGFNGYPAPNTSGIGDLVVTPGEPLRFIDGMLTGWHDLGTNAQADRKLLFDTYGITLAPGTDPRTLKLGFVIPGAGLDRFKETLKPQTTTPTAR